MNVPRDRQREQARKFLRAFSTRTDWLVVDTETTGPDEETDDIVELSVLTADGYPVVDALIQPCQNITEGAKEVHGITPGDVADARTMDQFAFVDALFRHVPTLIYNRAFDGPILANAFQYRGVEVDPDRWDLRCVMEAYAMGYGEWDEEYGSYSWVKLTKAATERGVKTGDVQTHRARGDAEITRRLVRSFEGEPEAEAEFV